MTRDELVEYARLHGWQESLASKRRQYDAVNGILVLQHGEDGERCIVTLTKSGNVVKARAEDGKTPLGIDALLTYLKESK